MKRLPMHGYEFIYQLNILHCTLYAGDEDQNYYEYYG